MSNSKCDCRRDRNSNRRNIFARFWTFVQEQIENHQRRRDMAYWARLPLPTQQIRPIRSLDYSASMCDHQ